MNHNPMLQTPRAHGADVVCGCPCGWGALIVYVPGTNPTMQTNRGRVAIAAHMRDAAQETEVEA
jgi:hypothetical protein